MTRSKPIEGHRCRPPLIAVSVRCECGWRSAEWYGTGARTNAYGEWRSHVHSIGAHDCPRAVDDDCKPLTPIPRLLPDTTEGR